MTCDHFAAHQPARPGRFRPLVALAWAGALTLMLTPAAWAQQRAGGNGHALDANPQAGSGGRNRVEGQVNYQSRNDVITGNVPGLGGFHGDVGYSAPGEFHGVVPSNDLFQFQRQSYTSAPGSPPNYNAGATTQPPVVLYRNFSSVPRNQIGRGPSGANVPGTSFGSTEFSGLRISADSLRANGGLPNISASGTGQTLGYTSTPQGQTVQLSASPLLGVRQQPLSPNQDISPAGRTTEGEGDQPSSAMDQRYQPPGQTLLDEQGNPPDQPLNPQAPGVNPNLAGQTRTTSTQVASSLVLGQQMQTRIMGRPNARPRTLDQQLAEIQSRIFQPLDQRVTAPGADPYLDILRRLRGEKPKNQNQNQQKNEHNNKGANKQNANNPANQNQNQNNANANAGREQGQPGEQGKQSERASRGALPPWAGGLKMPNHQQLQQAEQQRSSALDQLRHPTQEQNQDEQEQSEVVKRQNQELDRLMNKLSYNMPRLKTLVGQRKGRVAKQMKRGEQALADGKFFDAEDAYKRALTDEPNNPLARAGLVNAQLAAGLIRSASLNLRKLYGDHPELISTRYDPKLLPPKDRLQWLQGELMHMVAKDSYSADPGLMMAYLGYQVDSRQLIRYGLAIAQGRAPGDDLLPVLRRIWLGNPGSNADNHKDAPGGGR